MPPFLTINGKAFPTPKRGLGFEIATIVDSGRNSAGEVVGQRVGRDQQKMNDVEWGYLKASVWESMCKEFEKFFLTVTYPNMCGGGWTTREMYVGNRSAKPFRLNKETGLPEDYLDCRANLIDLGKAL